MWFKIFKQKYDVQLEEIKTDKEIRQMAEYGVKKNDPIFMGANDKVKLVRIFYNQKSSYYADLLKEVKKL
tara:strand:- start:45 stop:254 length:210 start_codon:yes stop_codon:yes gene_type:complete